MALQLFFLSLKLNFSLKTLLPTLLWMILGIFLLFLHCLTTSSLNFKYLIMTFPMPSMALILGRLTVRMESLLLFSKKLCFRTRSLSGQTFSSVSLLLHILITGSLLIFNLSLKTVTSPILLTTIV